MKLGLAFWDRQLKRSPFIYHSWFVAVEHAILCFAVSSTFHAVGFVSADDRLHILASQGLRQRMVVKLPFSYAIAMLITPTWGFFVIDFGYDIVVLTVNGEIVGRNHRKSEVAAWMAVASKSDFDFVVYVEWSGDVMIFEAAVPHTIEKLAQVTVPVAGIVYCRPDDRLLVVSQDGGICAISHPFAVFAWP
jgi:hypothetical protein